MKNMAFLHLRLIFCTDMERMIARLRGLNRMFSRPINHKLTGHKKAIMGEFTANLLAIFERCKDLW